MSTPHPAPAAHGGRLRSRLARLAAITGALALGVVVVPLSAAMADEGCADELWRVSPLTSTGDDLAVAITSQTFDEDPTVWATVSWEAATGTSLTSVTIRHPATRTVLTTDLDTGTAEDVAELVFCGSAADRDDPDTPDADTGASDDTDVSDDADDRNVDDRDADIPPSPGDAADVDDAAGEQAAPTDPAPAPTAPEADADPVPAPSTAPAPAPSTAPSSDPAPAPAAEEDVEVLGLVFTRDDEPEADDPAADPSDVDDTAADATDADATDTDAAADSDAADDTGATDVEPTTALASPAGEPSERGGGVWLLSLMLLGLLAAALVVIRRRTAPGPEVAP